MNAIYMNTNYLPLENVKSILASIEVALLLKRGEEILVGPPALFFEGLFQSVRVKIKQSPRSTNPIDNINTCNQYRHTIQ